MSKLEDEAAAFKRAKAAEKKRRQRNGGYVLAVEVHLPTLARMLLAEGLLKEGELEDVTAISAATAAHLRKHERVGRILPDQTPSLGNKWQEMERWVRETRSNGVGKVGLCQEGGPVRDGFRQGRPRQLELVRVIS